MLKRNAAFALCRHDAWRIDSRGYAVGGDPDEINLRDARLQYRLRQYDFFALTTRIQQLGICRIPFHSRCIRTVFEWRKLAEIDRSHPGLIQQVSDDVHPGTAGIGNIGMAQRYPRCERFRIYAK